MKRSSPIKTIYLGILGFGTVGSGVVQILKSRSEAIEKKTGLRLVVRKICVKNPAKKRKVGVARGILTTRPSDLWKDPVIDIVVELVGGVHPAKETILESFRHGKHVVTANKALLAEQGKIIFHEAARHHKKLGIEASVCGGIPIIKSFTEGLASNKISHFLGIVNGTCNYILSAMSKGSQDFNEALAVAQKKGYAESDPALDIDGIDSAHKLAVLARLAFGAELKFSSIHVEGIRKLSAVDVAYAKELGYVVKLLAIAKHFKEGLELRVHPTMLPLDHPLSNVQGVYNAVFVHADQAGDLLFYGRGAGMFPTASAVVSDVIDIAKKIAQEADVEAQVSRSLSIQKVLPIENIVSKYYLRFQVADKPGVLGRIAQSLGKHGISILSVHQKEPLSARSVPVVILTYEAQEKNLRSALSEIDRSKDVREKTVMMRVEQ